MVGPDTYSNAWLYNARAQLGLWAMLAVTFVFKWVGENSLGVTETGYMFALLAWVLKWSVLASIGFGVSMFLGYNNLFEEDYTMDETDKYDFFTLFLVQSLSWLCGIFLKDSMAGGDQDYDDGVVVL